MSRTKAVINENALLHNIQRVKQFAPNSPIIAMVKANAYGHGMERVSQVLAPEVDMLGVACLQEAQALRKILPKKPILLMGGVFAKEEWAAVFEGNFDVVIHQFWQIEGLDTECGVWLKIDTGMHRLGFTPEELPSAYEKLSVSKGIKPIGFMTHFACADDVSNPMTAQQMERFQSVIECLPKEAPKQYSFANSAAIMAWPVSRQGYIRPGIMLYGVSPFVDKTGTDLELKPVMSLQSHIVAIKTCKKDETVGYGAMWRASETCRIAVVAAGYGDGYPRHVSQDAVVWVNGHYLPIVGRVSMDMLVINLLDCLEAKVGDLVELWGENLPVERVARFANTSPYELVTQICSRVYGVL